MRTGIIKETSEESITQDEKYNNCSKSTSCKKGKGKKKSANMPIIMEMRWRK